MKQSIKDYIIVWSYVVLWFSLVLAYIYIPQPYGAYFTMFGCVFPLAFFLVSIERKL